MDSARCRDAQKSKQIDGVALDLHSGGFLKRSTLAIKLKVDVKGIFLLVL